MGVWSDVIKVVRSAIFKKELKDGGFSVNHASKADSATEADKIKSVSAVGSGADDAARYVWFSDSKTSGKPWGDSNFKYNPKTKTLFAKKLDGTATYAISSGALSTGTMNGLRVGNNDTGISIPNEKQYSDIIFAIIQVGNSEYERRTFLVTRDFSDANRRFTTIGTGVGTGEFSTRLAFRADLGRTAQGAISFNIISAAEIAALGGLSIKYSPGDYIYKETVPVTISLWFR